MSEQQNVVSAEMNCFDTGDNNSEVLDIIQREKREFENSDYYREMKKKMGAVEHELKKTNLLPKIRKEYSKGRRKFTNLLIENESFAHENLEGIIFENCMIYADFQSANLTSAQFLNGHVKTSDFRNANLTNAKFENVGVESTRFKGALTEGFIFKNNFCYGTENLNMKDFEEFFKNQ